MARKKNCFSAEICIVFVFADIAAWLCFLDLLLYSLQIQRIMDFFGACFDIFNYYNFRITRLDKF
jgi:hypothetical protein